MIVQDTESINIELFVELPEIDSFTLNRLDVASDVVTSDIDGILKDKSAVDDFINDEDDETLEEYLEEEFVESKDDDDINDGGDIQDISSDDE